MNYKHIRVTFFQLSDKQQKRNKIIEMAHEHFERKESLLIRLPHKQALKYVDLLLWRLPPDSFLPHSIRDEKSQDLIALTTSEENPNGAHNILNLCLKPVINTHGFFTRIYEIDDLSNSHKNHLTQEHYKDYKERGYTIHLL